MIVLGLTGGVGMGKSTAAAMLRHMGVPVHDADATVHCLMAKGGAAVAAVAKEFPDALRDGAIDRKALGRPGVCRPAGAQAARVASFIPWCGATRPRFCVAIAPPARRWSCSISRCSTKAAAARRVDAVVTMTVAPFLQRRRVLCRPGMTDAQFAAIQWRASAGCAAAPRG